MTTYRTKDGDMVDAICFDHYGDEAMMSAVYQANPGLAKYGPVLPRGLHIELPTKPAAPAVTPKRLW
ncbi:MAG: tail protein X [Planktomarina sp.]